MKDKVDKWFIHEGCDRAHMLLVMLQESFGLVDPDCELSDGRLHPSIWNDKCATLLMNATSSLAELYQEISEWENKNESNRNDAE